MKRATEYIEKLPTDAKLVECTDCYYVDTRGNVYSTKGRIKKLKPNKTKSGYLQVGIYYPQPDSKRVHKFKSVHVLVCETFFGKREGLEVNHKDGNKENNSISNLEWTTRSKNLKHAFDTGLKEEQKRKISKAHSKSIKVIFNDDVEKVFNSCNECADYLKVDKSDLSNYILGKKKFPKKYNIKQIYYL